MNKLLNKIAVGIVSIAMAVGVGVALGSGEKAADIVKASTTASVSIATYASTNKWSDGTIYSSVTIDSNISATSTGGDTYSGTYNSTNDQWRFYQTDSGVLTISASNNAVLNSVTLTFSLKDS